VIGALRFLPRCAAPAELEGRVVAALQAGHRQERSVRHLQALERREVPADLERALIEELSSGHPAPPELERRVASALFDDPQLHAARRAFRRLPRVAAPAALAERLERELAPVASRGPLRPRLLRVGLAAAAAFVLYLGLRPENAGLELSGSGRSAGAPAQGYSFEVRYLDDFQGVDATSRGWIDGITGGLSWALASR
jgi:hypothetical protein